MSVLVWDLAVAFAVLGFGFLLLRVLRFGNRPLALAGAVGLSLMLFLGGWLNLAGLLRRDVFFALASAGCLCLLFELVRSRLPLKGAATSGLAELRHLRKTDLVLGAAGLLTIALLALGPLRQAVWNNDDVSGYIPLAIKGLQAHSLQSDPFCDRRISSSVGGGIFVDVLMYATHNLRGMAFIDSVFGLVLYAAGLWALGRAWRLSVAHRSVLLLFVPVFTLMKVNLTAVYLSAAGFLAISLLFAQMQEEDQIGWRQSLLLGSLLGGLSALKSTNLVFVCLQIVLSAVIFKILRPQARILRYVAASFPLAALLLLPWSINQHRTEGTYLYPLLGKGFYASAYGFLPSLQTPHFIALGVIVALPITLLLAVGLIVTWKRTHMQPVGLRVSALAYLAAAVLAAPITGAGLGGDSVDRYIAPFAMPGLLFLLLLALAPAVFRTEGPSRTPYSVPALGLVALSIIYVAGFLGVHQRWYSVEATVLQQAFGLPPWNIKRYERFVDPEHEKALRQLTGRVQAAIPNGATVLTTVSDATAFDYGRQHILIDEYPGMVGPPPGMPIDGGPAKLLHYLRMQGIEYVVYDRSLIDPAAHWQDYEPILYAHTVPYFLIHLGYSHYQQPLGLEQLYVSQHVGEQLREIAQTQPVVFDDGRVFVMSLKPCPAESQALTSPGISR